jgi:ADP-heptose:LPS heptosyltransferase
MTALSGAKEKIGFDKNPLSFLFDVKVKHVVGTKDIPVHEVQRNLSLIKHFTNSAPAALKLYPSLDDYKIVETLTAHSSQLTAYKYICVAPSSVWFTKQFPKEKWIEFLKAIPSSFIIYFLGAASDKILCDEIVSALPNHTTKNLAGELSFLQSAALIQNAFMNYVNDSAPLHMASAMNAPVTAVFCSTVTWFGYGPLSDKSFVIEKEEPLYCRPCTLHGKKQCPEKHFKCALDINKDQLLVTLNYD